TPLGLGPVEELMLTATYNSMTCPMGVEEIEPLVTGREGLQAKVRALLGRDLPESFILAQDPFAPLDMSAAPKLSAVYLSYLVFKADFTGLLIARLLKYHASR